MTHNRRQAEPTIVSRVEAVFAAADDFVTTEQIRERAGVDQHHVQASLWWLVKMRAVDSLESNERLWWFATPATDLRTKRIEMRKKEDRPRRARRVKAKIVDLD